MRTHRRSKQSKKIGLHRTWNSKKFHLHGPMVRGLAKGRTDHEGKEAAASRISIYTRFEQEARPGPGRATGQHLQQGTQKTKAGR